jgi:transcription elongation factor Elf1
VDRRDGRIAVPQWSEERHGTYRCPVCGHRDAAVVEAEAGRGLIACSYCETLLEVTARGFDSVWFSVQVAEERAPR